MAKEGIGVLESMHQQGFDGDVDFLKEALRVLIDGTMDAEVSSQTSAKYGELGPDRITHRNGYRIRYWDTRVGTMNLPIPRIREGSRFPVLPEPPRRSEPALLALIQQAYVEGVLTPRVNASLKALGCNGISKPVLSLPKGAGSPASARDWTWWCRAASAGRCTDGPAPILARRPDPEGRGAAASAARCRILPPAEYEAEDADGYGYAVGEDPQGDLPFGMRVFWGSCWLTPDPPVGTRGFAPCRSLPTVR